MWLCPLYSVYTPAEERSSAQLAAVEMLKSGTTTLPRGGHDPLPRRGRRRAGRGRHPRPCRPLGVGPAARAECYRQTTDEAIGHLAAALDAHRSVADGRIGDVVDRRRPHHVQRPAVAGGARRSPTEHGVGMSFHMSPAKIDPDGFLAEFGQRPMVHLDEHRRARPRRGDDPLRPRRRRGDRRDRARAGTNVVALPDDGAQGQLRRHPDRQVARDGAARHQRRRSAPTATTRRTTPT